MTFIDAGDVVRCELLKNVWSVFGYFYNIVTAEKST